MRLDRHSVSSSGGGPNQHSPPPATSTSSLGWKDVTGLSCWRGFSAHFVSLLRRQTTLLWACGKTWLMAGGAGRPLIYMWQTTFWLLVSRFGGSMEKALFGVVLREQFGILISSLCWLNEGAHQALFCTFGGETWIMVFGGARSSIRNKQHGGIWRRVKTCIMMNIIYSMRRHAGMVICHL